MEKFYSYLKKRYTQLDVKGNLNIAWKLVIRDSVIFVFVLWALTFILFINGEKEWRGTFGDMFGAVNALFSGLAFVGLIITMIMQHEELKLQREELKQTNAELEGQKSLIETYALLNNIRKKELDRKNDLNLYLETAYRL